MPPKMSGRGIPALQRKGWRSGCWHSWTRTVLTNARPRLGSRLCCVGRLEGLCLPVLRRGPACDGSAGPAEGRGP